MAPHLISGGGCLKKEQKEGGTASPLVISAAGFPLLRFSRTERNKSEQSRPNCASARTIALFSVYLAPRHRCRLRRFLFVRPFFRKKGKKYLKKSFVSKGNSVLADRRVATYVEKQEKKNFFPSNIFLPTHLALRTAFSLPVFSMLFCCRLSLPPFSLVTINWALEEEAITPTIPHEEKKSNFQQQNSWASSVTHFFPTQVHTHTHTHTHTCCPASFLRFFSVLLFLSHLAK